MLAQKKNSDRKHDYKYFHDSDGFDELHAGHIWRWIKVMIQKVKKKNFWRSPRSRSVLVNQRFDLVNYFISTMQGLLTLLNQVIICQMLGRGHNLVDLVRQRLSSICLQQKLFEWHAFAMSESGCVSSHQLSVPLPLVTAFPTISVWFILTHIFLSSVPLVEMKGKPCIY